MKTFRRILCLIISILLVFAFASCNGEPEEKIFAVIFVENIDATVVNFPQQQNVKSGSKAIRPSVDPSCAGYVFLGWYVDEEGTEEFDFETTIITQRTFIFAKWERIEEKYEVIFDYNYDDAPSPEIIEVKPGNNVEQPDNPQRNGYRFMGWSINAQVLELYDFDSIVTGDIRLYAIWAKEWTVIFDLNYEGAPDVISVKVLENETVSAPSVTGQGPDGWSFGGWYNEKECLTEYEFDPVTSDVIVYAKWVDPSSVETSYIIIFDLNYTGSPAAETQEVLEGTSAERPLDPERDGWIFSGWFTAPSGGTLYNFGPVKQDITLYARWKAKFIINYNYTGAPIVPEQLLEEGQPIPTPQTPTRPNNPVTNYEYVFVGWSTAPDCDPNYNEFGKPFEGDTTIFAQWKHNHVFEAEYTDLDDVVGSSISGAPQGPGIIVKEMDWHGAYLNADASNGFYLSYLYNNGIRIFFDITSDRQTNAILWVRLSNEFEPMYLTDQTYLMKVNGEPLSFDPFYPSSIMFEPGSDYWWHLGGLLVPFDDYLGLEIVLNKGLNRIELITNNSESVGGTLNAVAPVVDCIKLDTTAKLTWEPRYDNLEQFLGEDWWL